MVYNTWCVSCKINVKYVDLFIYEIHSKEVFCVPRNVRSESNGYFIATERKCANVLLFPYAQSLQRFLLMCFF